MSEQRRPEDCELRQLPGFLCSKGLDVREVERGRFVIVDALGARSELFGADGHQEMLVELRQRANVLPLTHVDGSLLLATGHELDGATIPWSLEEPYVARIPDSYRIWLAGRGDHQLFDAKRNLLPLAYFEAGFGTGAREVFEEIHTEMMRKKESPEAVAIPREMLMAFLQHVQLQRLCDDQLALVDRAVKAFQRVLFLMREAVRRNANAIEQLQASEIEHAGPLAAEIATYVTVAVISVVSSMDLMTRFVSFVNDTDLPSAKFRPTGTTYYADLSTLRAKTLPLDVLDRIRQAWSSRPSLLGLVQFRHDLIHSTTALEIERKVYIGIGTPQVNSLSLHYAQIPARDCADNGQPLRFLGREYFTAQGRNMDEVLQAWLVDAVEAHGVTAREVRAFIDAARATATHTLPGCTL